MNICLNQFYQIHIVELKRDALKMLRFERINPLSSEMLNLNFQSLEVVSRYRDTHIQVTENFGNL